MYVYMYDIISNDIYLYIIYTCTCIYITEFLTIYMPRLSWFSISPKIWAPSMNETHKPSLFLTSFEHIHIYIILSGDELISDVLLWTPAHGQAKAGRSDRTYIQQLCEDTECSPEDLPEAMNNREEWRERVRDIHARGTTR